MPELDVHLERELSTVIATTLTGQAEAHLAIAEHLGRNGTRAALVRAHVHAELAHRWALLAAAEKAGRLSYAPVRDVRLKPRDLYVLRGLAAGETAVSMARGLFLAPDTIRANIKQVMRRLGARSREEAVALASRNGLLPEPVTLDALRRAGVEALNAATTGAGR